MKETKESRLLSAAQLLHTLHDILCIVNLDTRKIEDFNVYFLRWSSFDAEAIRSKSIEELFANAVPRENWALVVEQLKTLGFVCWDDADSSIFYQFTALNIDGQTKALVRIVDLEKTVIVEQYQALFERNIAGVFKTRGDGSVLDCNEEFARILGYNSKEVVKRLNAQSFYFENTDRQKFIEALRSEGYLLNYRITLRKMNGDAAYCIENTYVDRDENGQDVMVGTIIDISDQVRIEEALKESELRFRTLSTVGNEGVVFILNERIVDANEQFAQFFGIAQKEDVIGRKLTDFFSPSDLRRIFHSIQISRNNHQEVRTQAKSGMSLILDVSGTLTQLNGKETRALVVSDITARKKAELALEQTALRFRNLLENSPNALLILLDDRIRYLNPAGLELFGFDFEDELFNHEFLPLVSESHRQEVGRSIQKVRNGEEVDYAEVRVLRSDGKEIDAGIKFTLTVYENRPALQVTISNISERIQLVQEQMRIRIVEEINTVLKKEIEEHKITQQKLEEQKSFNENLINSSLDMIIASDPDGIIKDVNSAGLMQFGYTIDQLRGEHASLLFQRREDYDMMRKKLDDTGGFFGEIDNISANGRMFTSLLSASLIKDNSGQVIGSMGVSRDVTEYKANERRALEQKAKLESIFNSTENMMMWTMDKNYHATSFNHNFNAWAEGSLKEEVSMGTDIKSMLMRHLDEDLYQGQIEYFDYAFRGRPQQFEFPLKNAEGKTMWLQAFLNPVNLGDKPEEISCLVYDNTERKEIDRRVRDALKEKEVLLQEVHHRVKNNLQVISSILNLQSGYVTDPHTLEILRESQQRIKSMSFIHETLYRTSDFSNINFSDYLRSLVVNLIQSYRLQDTTISFNPEIDEVSLNIDQAIPCGLMVNEMISNALKYAFIGRKKGTITVKLKMVDGQVSLVVADDGVGLPKDFQYEKTDSLGVQLIYTLIEQLDGRIEVEGDKGTQFLITFGKR